MPDKKLTDNEIIKAWDVLAKLDFFGGQRAGRELWNEKPFDVQNKDIENFSKDIAFLKDLINRLQAENEELVRKLECLLCHATGGKLSKHTYPLDAMERCVNDTIQEYCEEAQAEAYKECIEKVKENFTEQFCGQKYDLIHSWFNNALKELGGDA